jgi:hypothetical protein
VASVVDIIEKLRDSDNLVLKAGIEEVTRYCNAEFSSSINDFNSLKHNILRAAGAEPDMVCYILHLNCLPYYFIFRNLIYWRPFFPV